jgi:zinc protease
LSPDKAVFLVWPTPNHTDSRSNALDLFAEILGGSDASPLHEILVKQEGIMSAAECFCLKGIGEGFFVLYGILAEGVSHQAGKEALLRVLDETIVNAEDDDLASVKNRLLTQLLYERISPAQQAQKIAYYAALGKPEWFDQEAEMLEAVSLADCRSAAHQFLNTDNARLLFYSPHHA